MNGCNSAPRESRTRSRAALAAILVAGAGFGPCAPCVQPDDLDGTGGTAGGEEDLIDLDDLDGDSGGGSTPPDGAPSASGDYLVAVNSPIWGALSGSSISGCTYSEASGQLLLSGMGGYLSAFDLPPPYRTYGTIRYAPGQISSHLSFPLGLAMAADRRTLLVLDVDYTEPPVGHQRLHSISAGADGLFDTADDEWLGEEDLPPDFDDAMGIAVRPSTGEQYFATDSEILVTSSWSRAITRRLAFPAATLGQARDLAFAGDRLMVVTSAARLVVLDPASGALVSGADDPIARISSRFSFPTLGLSHPGGVAAIGASPLFVANGESGGESVVIFELGRR